MLSYLFTLKLREIKEMESEKSAPHSSVESLCRTCLSSQELRPLFPLKSKYRSFERALFLCTGLQIKPDDGLPQTICRPCSKFVESAIRFRNQSCASQTNLIQLYKYKKKTSNVKKKHPVEIKKEQSKRNKVCLQNVEVKPKYTTHQVIPDNGLNTENININSTSTNNEWYGNEQTIDDYNLMPEKGNENEEVRNKKIKLSINDLKDTNYESMMENSGDPLKPIRCKECQKSMRTLLGFKVHVKRHTLEYNILCEYCGVSQNSKASLARHLQARHGMARDDRYLCSYCDFRALDQEQLEVHERRIHTKERPFVCHDCGEAFFSKRVLRQHMDVHSPDRPFQCHLCLHNFKSKGRLTGHIMKVHRTRKYLYKCSYCPKTYVSNNKTRIHMVKIHGIPKNQQGKLERFNIQEEDV